jgi:hypothetical protein
LNPARATWRGRCILIFLAFSLLAAVAPHEMPVPVEVQVPLLVKVLGFERTLAMRTEPELVIAVAYQADYRSSRLAMEGVIETARAAGALTVHGRPTRWEPLPVQDVAQFVADMVARHAAVVYFAPLRAVSVRSLADAVTAEGVVSLTGVPEYVREGVSVGIGERGGRPRILVHLLAARRAGADFAAPLLQLADVLTP